MKETSSVTEDKRVGVLLQNIEKEETITGKI